LTLLDRFRSHLTPDYSLLLVVFTLSLVGLLAISSASVVISFERFGYNNYYLIRQAISLVIGLAALAVGMRIDYQFWRKHATVIFGVAALLMVAVLIPGIGTKFSGAQRWFDIGPATIQPSELLKLSLIIYLAAWFEKRQGILSDLKQGYLPFLLTLAGLTMLIILQPDMGTAVTVGAIALTQAFAAGAPGIYLLGTVILGAISSFVMIRIEPYRFQRLLTFFNPEDPQGAAYHITQSLLAIGSGGLFGLGFGNSLQKYLYLPQAQTDSIFAILAEELGFLRAGAILLLFFWLIMRGIKIAAAAPDVFSRLLATGITAWIAWQAIINLGAMLGALPLTGVPLPFISYGGTALVVLLFGVGILLNISKHAKV
jgi:cell division protein FtsW